MISTQLFLLLVDNNCLETLQDAVTRDVLISRIARHVHMTYADTPRDANGLYGGMHLDPGLGENLLNKPWHAFADEEVTNFEEVVRTTTLLIKPSSAAHKALLENPILQISREIGKPVNTTLWVGLVEFIGHLHRIKAMNSTLASDCGW
jgi:hypothetical protein